MRGPRRASVASTQSATLPNRAGRRSFMGATLPQSRLSASWGGGRRRRVQLQVEADYDFVADPLGGLPFALADAERQAPDPGIAFHAELLRLLGEREQDRGRLGDAPQREFAVGAPALAVAPESGCMERRLRV